MVAGAGEPQRAEEFAQRAKAAASSMASLDGQALLLTQQAILATEPEQARCLMVHALQAGRWPECLAGLAHIEPAAIDAVVGEHLTILGSTSGAVTG